MSVSAVIERIKKLEANGIIKQYTVVLDSKKLGMDITAFISVSMEHPKYNNNFNEFVKTHKQPSVITSPATSTFFSKSTPNRPADLNRCSMR